MRTAFAGLIGLLAAMPAQAACTADASGARPHLVELYTSEGCSSCPPADDWLRHTDAAAVTALAFHVDYWDGLGWRDRFADARYTARQRQQARRDGGSAIYTPQVVLDGHGWSGWYRRAPLAPAPASGADLQVAFEPGAPLRVQVRAHLAGDAAGFANYVAVTEDGLVSAVHAGENRGAVLHHEHVVRAFAGPLPLAGATAELALPADLDRSRARLVAFVQRGDGAVAQVLSCALR